MITVWVTRHTRFAHRVHRARLGEDQTLCRMMIGTFRWDPVGGSYGPKPLLCSTCFDYRNHGPRLSP